MKKRMAVILAVLLLLPTCMLTAFADTGPKPGMTIEFLGLEEEQYYVTLLSESETWGPWSSDEGIGSRSDEKIWNEFKSYEDADGFCFIGNYGTASYNAYTREYFYEWSYYPPETFKILVYFPEYESFLVTEEAYTQYAFDTYYTVDAANVDITVSSAADSEIMPVVKSYDYTWEAISLLCRIVLCFAVEMGLALLFGYRAKAQIIVIAAVNLTTQVILNIALNVVNFQSGHAVFTAWYVMSELFIVLLEGILYSVLLPKCAAAAGRSRRPTERAWVYALTANILSFAAGMAVAVWVPGVF